MTTNGTAPVLVTGATGFLAQHCVLALLEAGHEVRGTARSASRAGALRDTLAPHLSPPARDRLGRFELVTADLSDDDGWDEAVAGCRFVLHVASPVPRQPPADEAEVIGPARDGTIRVLRAASAAGVERVVLTSSISAVLYGRPRDRTFTEDDWSDVDGPGIGAYEKSKTIAERAAWDLMAELGHDGPELVAINPGLILGPLLDGDWGTSGEVVKKLLDGSLPGLPDLNWAPVDVRDVAAAHLAALTAPGAAGRRFITALENHSLPRLAGLVDAHLAPRGYRVPRRRLPSPLLRVAARFDRALRLALNDLGRPQDVDASSARAVLGWRPRPMEETMVDMVESMLDHGVIPLSPPDRSHRRSTGAVSP